MPQALDLIGRGIARIQQLFGTTAFTIQGQAQPITGNWNELGRTEEIVLQGKRVSFSCVVEATKTQFEAKPVQGQLVTRQIDGFTGRIVGQVQSDDLTYRFALDSRNK